MPVGNLVMHFPKIANVPRYLVVGGEGAGGPHKLMKGTFFYVPQPKYTNFQQKYPCTTSGKTFVIFE